jgi:hypothetical protein
MKEITVKVYQFEELSEDAQKKAIEDETESQSETFSDCANDDHPWKLRDWLAEKGIIVEEENIEWRLGRDKEALITAMEVDTETMKRNGVVSDKEAELLETGTIDLKIVAGTNYYVETETYPDKNASQEDIAELEKIAKSLVDQFEAIIQEKLDMFLEEVEDDYESRLDKWNIIEFVFTGEQSGVEPYLFFKDGTRYNPENY